ncbi:DeoR family transcriptional regulator [Bacillaceae bacterium W0354]
MLPSERQKRIKELIIEHHHLRISDLSKELNVSEMTIHRDLKPLINEGLVEKTFGGISLIRHEQPNMKLSKQCILCQRQVNERLAYRIILTNHQIEVACCAHCGLLRTQQLGHSVVQAICPDFFRQTTISASSAWYVMDTSIQVGCCQPQVLTFEWNDHANKFVKGFGGNVYSHREAIDVINQKMSNEHCHHN